MPLWLIIGIIIVWVVWTIMEVSAAITVVTNRHVRYTKWGMRWTIIYGLFTIYWWSYFFFGQ